MIDDAKGMVPRLEPIHDTIVAEPASVIFSRFPPAATDGAILVEHEGPALEPNSPTNRPISFDGPYADTAINVMAPYVDRHFYFQTYPDAAKSGLDPVVHFSRIGWRERRRPNAWFDTEYYLTAYPDITAAEVNPLWHYLVSGQHEGRQARNTSNVRQAVVDRAEVPGARPAYQVAPPDARQLGVDDIVREIMTAAATSDGFALSVSHDCYIHNFGGTQIFIADEQSKFNGDRITYCHVSPASARLTLAPPGTAVELQIVLDGEFIGVAAGGVMLQALRCLPVSFVPARLLIVHCLFGHNIEELAACAEALRPTDNFFWIHDFSSICEGFNLLRNDATYCGAPPPTSLGCRVCVYGVGRAAHQARVRMFFSQINFHVVAPSQSALDVWLAGAGLPHLDTQVHPHCQLVEAQPGVGETPQATTTAPARVAFIGHGSFHKGYASFRALVAEFGGSDSYKFYHFGSASALTPMFGVELVPVTVTRDNPRAMVAALAWHNVDIVLILAPWPETFSYVTFEALASGADVVALAAGGNVPAAVIALQRGMVLRDDRAVIAAFRDGQLAAYVSQQRAVGKRHAALEFSGTTATIGHANPVRTAHPALRALVGGHRIEPVMIDDRTYRFDLPPGCASVRLVSRSAVPNWVLGSSHDNRRLGVAITLLKLDGEAVALDDPRFAGGWFQAEPDHRWTNGNATLVTGRARRVDIVLAPLLSYWATGWGNGAAAPVPPVAAKAMRKRQAPLLDNA